MNRDVSTQKELGAFVHDARMKLGLTQEALADRAGVSRKWLIGLEQGVRTRAELGKVLDTFEALGISINLSFNAEPEIESSDEDRYQSIAHISPAASEAIRKASRSRSVLFPKIGTLEHRSIGLPKTSRIGAWRILIPKVRQRTAQPNRHPKPSRLRSRSIGVATVP